MNIGDTLKLDLAPVTDGTLPTTVQPVTPGTDEDGTVEFYQFNPATFPTANEGQFFVGDPDDGGRPIDGTNTFAGLPYRIAATDLENLYFVAGPGFYRQCGGGIPSH